MQDTIAYHTQLGAANTEEKYFKMRNDWKSERS